jgi:hypothetical protein
MPLHFHLESLGSMTVNSFWKNGEPSKTPLEIQVGAATVETHSTGGSTRLSKSFSFAPVFVLLRMTLIETFLSMARPTRLVGGPP